MHQDSYSHLLFTLIFRRGSIKNICSQFEDFSPRRIYLPLIIQSANALVSIFIDKDIKRSRESRFNQSRIQSADFSSSKVSIHRGRVRFPAVLLASAFFFIEIAIIDSRALVLACLSIINRGVLDQLSVNSKQRHIN